MFIVDLIKGFFHKPQPVREPPRYTPHVRNLKVEKEIEEWVLGWKQVGVLAPFPSGTENLDQFYREETVSTLSPMEEGLDLELVDEEFRRRYGEQKRQVADPDHLPYDPRMGF